MTRLLLDTHVLYWMWAGAEDRLSPEARALVGDADELMVAAISWYELALLFERGRIEATGTTPAAALASMADRVTTAPVTTPIAQRAAALEHVPQFPRDPADRLIFATAVERSIRLVTRDGRMLRYSADVCVG